MQMVFVGLDIIVPLMTVELLKFPALSVAYFQLLAHMLEVYPERVLALPGKAILLYSFRSPDDAPDRPLHAIDAGMRICLFATPNACDQGVLVATYSTIACKVLTVDQISGLHSASTADPWQAVKQRHPRFFSKERES